MPYDTNISGTAGNFDSGGMLVVILNVKDGLLGLEVKNAVWDVD
jgi:hypothetical protein